MHKLGTTSKLELLSCPGFTWWNEDTTAREDPSSALALSGIDLRTLWQYASRAIVWGAGKAKREFLAADDLGDGCVFVIKHYAGDGFFNIERVSASR